MKLATRVALVVGLAAAGAFMSWRFTAKRPAAFALSSGQSDAPLARSATRSTPTSDVPATLGEPAPLSKMKGLATRWNNRGWSEQIAEPEFADFAAWCRQYLATSSQSEKSAL